MHCTRPTPSCANTDTVRRPVASDTCGCAPHTQACNGRVREKSYPKEPQTKQSCQRPERNEPLRATVDKARRCAKCTRTQMRMQHETGPAPRSTCQRTQHNLQHPRIPLHLHSKLIDHSRLPCLAFPGYTCFVQHQYPPPQDHTSSVPPAHSIPQYPLPTARVVVVSVGRGPSPGAAAPWVSGSKHRMNTSHCWVAGAFHR